MICPFCLVTIEGRLQQCPSCNSTLPIEYLELHSQRGDKGLIILSVVGFPGHGKTIYLTTLMNTLQSRMPQIWRDFTCRSLNMKTVETLHENATQLDRGEMPERTRRNFPEPRIYRLQQLPQAGNQYPLQTRWVSM